MKHWTPRIADAAEAAVASGAEQIVGLVLAPHYSALSIAGYREQLERALAGRAELRFVESWHDEPGFVELLADRVRGTDAHVVFTAHSLPARILEAGDPYRDQLLETSRLVAEAAGLSGRGASPSRASRRPASRGSGRTSSTTSRLSGGRASSAFSSARSASSPIISRSAGISTSRRRRRQPSSACSSSGSRCRTPTRNSLTRLGSLCARPCRYRHLRELTHLPRLARADGDRAGASVQALHRRRGEAAGGRAHAGSGHLAVGGRDLLRSRHGTSSTARHTDPSGSRTRCAASHWFEVRDWVAAGRPGSL